MLMKSFRECIELETFDERLRYLALGGVPGEQTLGGHRHGAQAFYMSREWQDVRRHIILRDFGCDLGIEDRPIRTRPLVHHINPITIDDINSGHRSLVDPNNLVLVSHDTHNRIHFGSGEPDEPIVQRRPGDHILW